MSKYDPPPGPLAKLAIGLCLAVTAVMIAASVLGMTQTLDRLHHLAATDCEMVADRCPEESSQ